MFKRDGKSYGFSAMEKTVREDIDKLSKSKSGRKYEALKTSNVETAYNILDVGCEIGTLLRVLKQKAPQSCKLTGIDVNEDSVKIAKHFIADKDIKILHSTSEKLPFEDSMFDRVFALEVVEHLRNVETSLKEINRVMAKGGLFILSVPNATALRSLLVTFFSDGSSLQKKIDSWPNFAPDQRDHVNNYDFLHLYRILSLSGFKFSSIAYTGWQLPSLGKIPVLKKFSSTMVLCVEKR